jgi:glycosyltransferase involved in cell wall biosynthesis
MLASLSIVIPAFNEEASIARTIEDALEAGRRVTSELEVLVCNDGSADATSEHVARFPEVRLIDHPVNLGIEASIRDLYAAARGEWVFLNSADRQWPMSNLYPMVEAAERGADFVVGVRENKREVYSHYRRIVSWSYERLVSAMGAPARDPGSIKLARRKLLARRVVSRGVFAEGERVIRASRDGARIVEVPVEFVRRGAGKATGARAKVVARAALDAVRLASSLRLGWPRP